MDQRESAVGNADSGLPPIIPGAPDSSELIARISATDESERMPPGDTHTRLSNEDVQTIKRWIAQGATYEGHWSFEAPRRPPVPTVNRDDWPLNEIDHFILHRLESEGQAPSGEASRTTLIRRVTLDLTGLPPTIAEVDAFVSDDRTDAYERLVDRLIQTEAYAERRAQDWLDLARYADTRGYADDQQRTIWPWRDWVVRAIHRNMPFDRFTIEQLAGDMLPNATMEQKLATAFHRNAPQAKGQTYPVEEYRIKGVIDRVNTTGTVWLGLSMGCAQCHDHKFDPITQRDYFSLFAIFNNVVHSGEGFGQGGPTMKYLPPIVPAHYDHLVSERDKLAAQLKELLKLNPAPLPPLNKRRLLGKWDTPTAMRDPNKYCVTDDFTVTARIKTDQPVVDILSKYDWRANERSYVFGIGGEGEASVPPGHLFCWVSATADRFEGIELTGSFPVNDGAEHLVSIEFKAGESLRLFVDGVEDRHVTVKGNAPSTIAVSKRPLAIGAGYNNRSQADAYAIDGDLRDVRLYAAALGKDLIYGDGAGEAVSSVRSRLRALNQQIKTSQTPIGNVPVMRERSDRRTTYIHIRGSFLDRGESVDAAIPKVFSTPTKQAANRLTFARWLVNGDNPLVARVFVNRLWQSYFGRGLVSTTDDFGTMGALPTHAKLLDWLAVEFVESGWDMKRINRLIVTSAAYRQHAIVTPANLEHDPNNELLGRAPRIRLSAEQIRDQALFVSGLLVRKSGGPPAFPHQPANYWEQRALPGRWVNSQGENRYRRTIYTYWRRMALHPALEILDAPSRSTCIARRESSNLPTQALVLLNERTFTEAANGVSRRVVEMSGEGDRNKLDFAFKLVLGRAPSVLEQTRFLDFLRQQRIELTKARAGGTPLTRTDVEHRVWSLACGVLLNLDETVTRP